MSGTERKPRSLNQIMLDAGVEIVRATHPRGPREYWKDGKMLLRTSSYDTAWNYAKDHGWTVQKDEE